MKLLSLNAQGVGCYTKPIAIDFQALGPGIVALAAPVGGGKTTVLEMAGPGWLYRECPTREASALHHAFPSGKGFLQVRAELSGEVVEAELRVEAGRVVTALLSTRHGPVADGKLSTYDRALRGLVGPKEAFYASVYGMQGGDGRVSRVATAERRSIFRHYLQLDRIEVLRKRAREKRTALEEVRRLQRQVGGDLPWVLAEIPKVEAQLAMARERLPDLVLAKATAQASFRALQQQAARAGALAEKRRSLAALEAAQARLVERSKAAYEELWGEDLGGGEAPDPPSEAQRREVAEAHRAQLALAEIERQAERLVEGLQQAERQSERLGELPCRGVGPYAACPLIAHAVEATRAGVAIPSQLDALQHRYQGLKPLAEQYETLAARLASDERAREQALRRSETVTARRRSLETLLADAEKEYERLDATGEALRQELGGATESPVDSKQLVVAENEMERATSVLNTAEAAVHRLEGELLGLGASKARLEALRGQEIDPTPDIDALDLLDRALAPTGLQALELDALGPDLAELANALLAEATEGRFALRLATTRDLDSRAGIEEVLQIRVRDTHRPDECSIRDLSGGEQVLVDEALRIALAVYANRQLERPFETLYRDESTGAFDADTALDYVLMLRAAMQLGGFYQTLLVAHHPAVIDASDVVLRIRPDTSIAIERPR